MDFHALNHLDFAILGLMLFSVIMGILRGFVREAMSLITWLASIFLGFYYFKPVSMLFSSIPLDGLRLLLSFLAIVLSTLIIGGLINYLIGRLIKFTGFGVTDRMIGTIFGVARGAAIVAAAVLIVSLTPITKDPLWQDSNLVLRFMPLSQWLKNQIPDNWIEELPDDLMKRMQTEWASMDSNEKTKKVIEDNKTIAKDHSSGTRTQDSTVSGVDSNPNLNPDSDFSSELSTDHKKSAASNASKTHAVESNPVNPAAHSEDSAPKFYYTPSDLNAYPADAGD